MSAVMILLLILLVVSGAGLIVFILLHSGKGTGLSDMISAAMYNTTSGTSIVEKNLDHITIIFAVVFILTLIIMMVVWPQGTISA
ncbi:MAG: preprotein translocase subunit SecG [Eggerthellales bacterium]|nr:preprotein translocase subunit SecG [Eggerthellales bacterium]